MKYIPLLVFIFLCLALAIGLAEKRAPDAFASKMIGQKITPFTLESLEHKTVTLPRAGKVTVLNVFASWCESCQAEHAVLLQAKDREIIGIAWKDTPEKITAWLEKRDDPYQQVLMDEKGKSTLPLALSGVPETFVIDKTGIVRYNKKAPITEEELNRTLLPLVEKLNAE